MSFPSFHRVVIALLLIGVLAACGGDKKDESGKDTTSNEATLSAEQAQVELRQGENWTPVSASAPVRASDAVRTDASGQAVITFYTGTQVDILPNSEIVIEAFEPVENGGAVITLNQISGETLHRVELVADVGSRYEVNTPVAHLTVRGTEFLVEVAPDGATRVEVIAGIVRAEIGDQTLEVNPGQAIDVTAAETTTGPYEINPILPPDLTTTPGAQRERATPQPSSTPPPPITATPTRDTAPTATIPAISVPPATETPSGR